MEAAVNNIEEKPPITTEAAVAKKIKTTTPRFKAIAGAACAAKGEKRKSSTAILCELTRLKSQQKYLECSQVKLHAKNFEDDEQDVVDQSPSVASLINEIESVKVQLEEELAHYRQQARNDVQDFCLVVNGIREDVFQPERLLKFSMQAMRDRIIAANAQLERLSANNVNELIRLRNECFALEAEISQLTKAFF